MDWKERVIRLGGSADDRHKTLKAEGYYVSRREVRDYVKGSDPVTVTINGDETTSERIIKGTAEQMRSADFLLREHGFDTGWELIGARSSMWQAQTPDGIEQLYSSRVTVKPTLGINEDKLLDTFMEKAAKYSPVKPRLLERTNEHLLLLNISDLHLGQLSWGVESGENYDSKIAVDNFLALLNDAANKSPYKEYARIVLIIGNDFFNTDNTENSTTKGTPQYNDVRHPKMFDMGCDVLINGIDLIRNAFPTTAIEVLTVPGNHEIMTIYHAAKVLWAWFRNDDTVSIDVTPRLHKGFAFGNTALLFSHGEREKKNLDWVYTEFRHLIGQTKYTELHFGHEHRIRVEEKNGAMVRVNPSPAPLNAWSYGEGYGSIAQTISRVYDYKSGLEYEIYSRV